MELKIFYSWQSDLPKNQNLNFIETSINDALKKLRQKETISLNIKLHCCPEKFYHSVSCLGPSPSGTLVVRSV